MQLLHFLQQDEFFGTPQVVDVDQQVAMHHAHRDGGEFSKEKAEHI